MYLVSKFRIAFWIRQFINYVGGLCLIGVCVYYSCDHGKIDFRNALFWLACFGLLSFIGFFSKFLFFDLKRVTVTDWGVEVKSLLTKQTITYEEMTRFVTKRITGRQGAGRTPGYRELEIQLTYNRSVFIDEDQFENYNDIKNMLYQNRKFT